MSEGPPELEVRGLVKRYAASSVVGPISFKVAAGEFVSVLGPSGCGKTTTLRCIAGFESPDEGSILLNGQSIERDAPNVRNIGLVFQSYALFPHLTVFDNVAFGLRLRRLPKAEIRERAGRALELVSLSHACDRYPRQLSGGQQQRVAIARSVVLEPRVILFDEPLSNLDLKLRMTMRTELRALQRRLGKTALYVTHDQGEALSLSDRVVVLSNGKVEQIGTPSEIYDRPASPFVADFIGSANLIETVLEDASCVRVGELLRLLVQEAAFAPGTPVLAVIRPEHILLGGEGQNAFSARVEEMTYLGQDLQVLLRTSGINMTLVTRGGAARQLGLGDEVSISVAPENIYLLAR